MSQRAVHSAFVVATLLGAQLVFAGCASGPQVQVALPAELQVEAIAVYPFNFRWPESPARSFLLSQRLVQQADAAVGDRVLLFAPPDFRVYRPEDNGWAGSNAVALFPSWQVRPDHALVLRAWAERRAVSSRQEISNAAGEKVGSTSMEETTYLAHVELISPSTRSVVVEVTGKAKVDPFAERPADDPDPTPELTVLLKTLLAEALKAIEPAVRAAGPARSLGLTTSFVAQAALTYEEGGRGSLEQWLQTRDPLEADVERTNVMRFANPGLPDQEATRFTRLPGGLFVTGLPSGSRLRPGDLIVQIHGEPAFPQTLQRARFLPGPVPIQVRHPDGSLAILNLP